MADEDPAKKIFQHVVLLMLENRSFDQMLATTFKDNPNVVIDKRVRDAKTPEELDKHCCPLKRDASTLFPSQQTTFPDPGHDFHDAEVQVFGDKARPRFYFKTGEKTRERIVPDIPDYKDATIKPENFVMAYKMVQGRLIEDHPNFNANMGSLEDVTKVYRENDVPVLSFLAKQYAVCDEWYSSLPGPTVPNRYFLYAGTSGNIVENDPIKLLKFQGRTIFQHLSENNKTWKIYFHDAPTTAFLASLWGYSTNYTPFDKFKDDVKNDSLPAFSFIEPRYYDYTNEATPLFGNDQHPPHSTLLGEMLIADIYNTLVENEAVFKKTLYIILYDEWGGFYDSVKPPSIPAEPNQHRYGFKYDRLGFRVPAVFVSPYIKPGKVLRSPRKHKDQHFEHCSLPASLIDLFLDSKKDRFPKRVRDAATFLHLVDDESKCREEIPKIDPNILKAFEEELEFIKTSTKQRPSDWLKDLASNEDMEKLTIQHEYMRAWVAKTGYEWTFPSIIRTGIGAYGKFQKAKAGLKYLFSGKKPPPFITLESHNKLDEANVAKTHEISIADQSKQMTPEKLAASMESFLDCFHFLKVYYRKDFEGPELAESTVLSGLDLEQEMKDFLEAYIEVNNAKSATVLIPLENGDREPFATYANGKVELESNVKVPTEGSLELIFVLD